MNIFIQDFKNKKSASYPSLERSQKEIEKINLETVLSSLSLKLEALVEEAPVSFEKKLLNDLPEYQWMEAIAQEKQKHSLFIEKWIDPVHNYFKQHPEFFKNPDLDGFLKRMINYHQQIQTFEWDVLDYVLRKGTQDRLQKIQTLAQQADPSLSYLAKYSLLKVQTIEELHCLLPLFKLNLKQDYWLFLYRDKENTSIFQQTSFLKVLIEHFKDDFFNLSNQERIAFASHPEHLSLFLSIPENPSLSKNGSIFKNSLNPNQPFSFIHHWITNGVEANQIESMMDLLYQTPSFHFAPLELEEWLKHIKQHHRYRFTPNAKTQADPLPSSYLNFWDSCTQQTYLNLEKKLKHLYRVQSYYELQGENLNYEHDCWKAVLKNHPQKDTLDEEGWGLIHHAASIAHYSFIQLLVDAGWNGGLKSLDELTPFQVFNISQKTINMISKNLIVPNQLKLKDIEGLTVLLEKAHLQSTLKPNFSNTTRNRI